MEYYLMESEALNEKPDQEEVWGKEELQTRK